MTDRYALDSKIAQRMRAKYALLSQPGKQKRTYLLTANVAHDVGTLLCEIQRLERDLTNLLKDAAE